MIYLGRDVADDMWTFVQYVGHQKVAGSIFICGSEYIFVRK